MKAKTETLEPVLLIDGSHGIYVPQEFAKRYNPENSFWVYPLEDATILRDGPNQKDPELYWEVWETVLDSACYKEEGKPEYTLYQDGDLWAIPPGWNVEQWEPESEND